MNITLLRITRRLWVSKSGTAVLEFAFVLPILVLMSLTGAELTNYITVKMRISQIALHVADNAARMGNGSQLSAKTVTETDVNDLLTGAQLQAGEIPLYGHGRVILSSLEIDPAHAGKYRIKWQRCRGTKTDHVSTYGLAGRDNMDGMGPATRQVTVQNSNATMYVEVYYEYVPLIGLGSLAPSRDFVEVASMSVRDRRDLTTKTTSQGEELLNTEGAAISRC